MLIRTVLGWIGLAIPAHGKELTQPVKRLWESDRQLTRAIMLVQSPAAQTAPSTEVVQVTGVKVNPTEKGVEVLLQTSKAQQLQITNRSVNNSFITDIPNTQLRLPIILLLQANFFGSLSIILI
ncbi:AMIN domain-containing protein [Nostoc sp.]|uniref:AMIN domain-containing protein n=1 Tax=Nostoc sp. TaxID=1180 RepID=UPI003FA58768